MFSDCSGVRLLAKGIGALKRMNEEEEKAKSY
jgi:hypothetical protein